MMNFFRKQQPSLKLNHANESIAGSTLGSNGIQLPSASTSSLSSTSSNTIRNVSPINSNTNNLPTNKPKPMLNLNNSSTTLFSLNTPTPPNNNNNINSQNSQNTFVLPSINKSISSSKHSNSDTFSKGLGLMNTNSNSPFSSSSSLMKNKPKDIRNQLEDLKAHLDTEINSQLKQDSPLNISRPVLLPINTPNSENSSLAQLPIGGTTPRIRRDNLKQFDFRTGINLDANKLETSSSTNNSSSNKVVFNLNDRSQSSSNNIDTPLSLNLPLSSRSSSASSVSLSSSSSSLAPNSSSSHYRLEAVNSDKFREIMRNAGYLLLSNERIKTAMTDLIHINELGSGTCGYVNKMKHNLTGHLMAVKQMSISGIVEENKRIIMDLDVVIKSHDCKNIVKCYGFLISESDVWICMELMSMCFDKLLKLNKGPIPEDILGKLTVSILIALNYLKEQHNVIHRDVKPSNILIDENGEIKLCDFGISGNLINSNAISRNNAGCAGYMAPERIDPADPQNPSYDIRADVWSLGITLVELATGQYPYKNCNNEFEVMSAILTNDAPKLEGDQFSDIFKSFVNDCLIKDYHSRPKYNVLLKHKFVKHFMEKEVDVKQWFKSVLETKENLTKNESIQNECNTQQNE